MMIVEEGEDENQDRTVTGQTHASHTSFSKVVKA